MLALDHVIVVVDDLDVAATRFEREHGLGSVPGGRHPGHGTGNRIIPLGTTYIELMAVVAADEAASSPMGRWAAAHTAPGPTPAGLCLRANDIDAVADRLGLDVHEMSRVRPDGVTLRWRYCGLDEAFGPHALPFFIRWEVPTGLHPGADRVVHATVATGLAWVEVGGDPTVLAERLGASDVPVRTVGGQPGVRRFAISTAEGERVVG